MTKEAEEAEERGEPTVKIIYCCKQTLPKGAIKRVSLNQAKILLRNHSFFFESGIIQPAKT